MMNWFRACLLLVIVGVTQFYSLEVQAASKGPEIGTQGQSAEARAKAMAALFARLTASPRAAVRHTVTLSDDEAGILANPRVDSTGRFRVGVHRSVGRTVSNKGDDLIVSIPGTQGIRLELAQVKGTVVVFNDLGEAHEYTEDGYTHTFTGDAVRVRGSAHVSGAGAVNLGGNLCTENASCVENAECATTMPANIADARDAYASILYASGNSYYICTGGLLADSDPGETPYFLTAHHCISIDREASSVETRFHYVLECNTPSISCTRDLSAWGNTVGSTIKATDSAGDFTLLELSETPPAGSVYLGWNSDPVAFTNGADLYRISHPGGHPQAYSTHEVDTSAGICGTLPRGTFIYSRDTFGATEGGSSGSPVLNASAQVVGQLYGACGTNVYDQCDAASNATVDGAFADYYAQVQPFLGDGNPGSPECSEDGECDDGIFCNGAEICSGGVCQPGSDPCTSGQTCDEINDLCDESVSCGNNQCEIGEDCVSCPNDCRAKTNGNPNSRYCCNGSLVGCGDNRCSDSPWACGTGDGGSCSVDGECDDGLFCNGTETCVGGACQSGSDPCSSGETCNEAADSCSGTISCSGNKATCDDNTDCCSGNCKGGTCKGN